MRSLAFSQFCTEKWGGTYIDVHYLIVQLLWVKENLQESWSMVCRWMDLSDWLAYR